MVNLKMEKRMEKLDVLFANRYLKAYTQFVENETPTKSWQIAFNNTSKYWPIVLQHLLWGINAHINLDLGIAASETAKGTSIDALKIDFDKINELLAELVGEVEKELTEVWPTLKWILTFTGKVDDFLINFSMQQARDGAWKFAKTLYSAIEKDKVAMVEERDVKVSRVASYINPKGLILKIIFGIIRIGEKGTVKNKIDILE